MNRATRRAALLGGVSAVALLAAHWLDFRTAAALAWPAANDRDWGRMLRVAGFAPTWLVVAAAMWLENRRDRAAVALIAAVAAAGLGAEIIKLLIRRERPEAGMTGYTFRSFADHPFSSRDFGFPSSHVMVAAGAAGALGHRFPRALPVLLGLAAGCGLTRLFAGAHFLSDVVAGLIGGVVIGTLAARRLVPSGGSAA